MIFTKMRATNFDKMIFYIVDESSDRFYHISICVDQANFPLANALATGQETLEKGARCYVRYKLYDRGKQYV